MASEQMEINFFEHDLTLEFAQAILKNSTITYTASAHNDRWTQTDCAFCHAGQSWSPPFEIPHKYDCIVHKAQEYVNTHS